MSKSRRATPWVVMGGQAGEMAHCRRCGTGLVLNLPQEIEVFVGALDGFCRAHSDCPKPAEGTTDA